MADITPDAVKSWVDRLPPRAQPYARLARFDRPAGIWLLFWPCLFGLFLAPDAWPFAILFFIGAVAMRAAGCIYNDIIDRDLDAQVARTAARPIASGAVSVRAGWVLLVALSMVGLAVLLALPVQAQMVALGSLLLVAAYPFMKRITWWPQAWLGLTFNWGVWVGWATLDAADRPGWPIAALLYAAGFCWTLGYDSIYAAQDSEDDALAGIKSSARRMGGALVGGVGLFYALVILFMALAFWGWRANPVAFLALIPVAAHFGWQTRTLAPGDTANALRRFQSNREAGGLMALAVLAAALLDAGIITP
jgi:4-hydroxybenzoate polyprenyltransferase